MIEVNLVVVNGKSAGQILPVPGPRFFIGRAEDCQLRPRSETVSRHHCAILLEEGFAAVRDFGSKNGTFVNGQRIGANAELKHGDRLRIGQLEFEVQLSTEVGGRQKPNLQSVREAAAPAPSASAPPDEERMKRTEWMSGDTGAAIAAETPAREHPQPVPVAQTQPAQPGNEMVTRK